MKLIIRWRPLALFALALLGLALRLYGLNWDQGNSFHPDERQILFHVTTLSWPTSLAQFFDAHNSPLNPHFFAYGSFPLYLLAIVGTLFLHSIASPGAFVPLTLIGRILSALFDSGTIVLTGWLGLLLTHDSTPGRRYGWSVALLGAALMTFTPLQLQLSHFYAVDTILLFFVVLTILACVALVDSEKPVRWLLVAGVGYGLALATKFSAAPLAVPLLVAIVLRWYRQRDLILAAVYGFFTLTITLLIFFLTQPYALLDMPNFVQQVAEQGSLARGTLDLPYVRQFAGTVPFIYQAQNMLFWGLGVTLGLAAGIGLLWMLWRFWKRTTGSWLIILSWIFVYGVLVGSFYVKFMRYMLPLYPFLTLLAAAMLIACVRHDWHRAWISKNPWPQLHRAKKHLSRVLPAVPIGLLMLVLVGTIFQGLALLNVYSQPNTRIQASNWMYHNLQPGSVLTYEQWDDPLPVPVGNQNPTQFTQLFYPDASGQMTSGLDLYGDDTPGKAQLLATLLPKINVITMATDRLDKSIPRLPLRYPLTIHYYQLLFSGQLGFRLTAHFENHPHLLGITLNDSNADESYSVFDHPNVRIFVRENPYPYTSQQLFQKLMDGVQLPL